MDISTGKYKKLFLSTLVVGLLALLLAACGANAAGAGQSAAGTQVATPHPTSGSGSTPTAATKPDGPPATTPLLSIRMLDQMNGWALTNTAVLKTADGGSHWRTLVSLPTLSKGSTAAGDFMDSTHAWVTFHAANTAQGTFTVLRTTDGGASWQNVSIQDTTAESIYDGIDRAHFITPLEGWVTAGQAEGMFHSSMTIFHTTDGGQHWSMIANTAPQSTSGLPDSGNKTGISFKDSQTGWVTADIPAVYSWLYKSSDGGKTWQEQKLPLPREATNAEQIGEFTTTPPVFFGNDGLLPVLVYYQSQPSIDLYVTHDGGKTWAPTKLAPIDGRNVYIADMQHAWASDKTGFYATSDGGEHWTKLGQPSSEIGEMSFVDTNIGWAIGPFLLDNKSPLLLHTIDGGKTWQPIIYYIQ